MNGFPDRFPPGHFQQGQMPGFHDGMQFYADRHGFEHHGGHHWLGFLVVGLLLCLLVLLVVAVLRGASAARTASGGQVGAQSDEALAVLRLRYARGEIGRDDFLVAHRDLDGGPGPPDAQPA